MRPWMRAGSRFLGGSRKWYRAGGAPAPVAAYQPKGAASLAASYVNLVTPGTNNCAPGTAPTFAAATGWTFASASSQYLVTTITPATDQTWSMVIRYADLQNTGVLAGSNNGTTQRFRINSDGTNVQYWNGASTTGAAATPATGVVAIAGDKGYLNGVRDGAGTAAAWGGAALPIYIGCNNTSTGAAVFFKGNIYAIAIYNSVLTAPQILAVSTAMAAL